MSKISEAIGRLEKDRQEYFVGGSCKEYPDLISLQYFAMLVHGLFPIEHEDGFAVVMTKRREVIPVDFHLPHGVTKSFERGDFQFTTNQDFAGVMRECLSQRDAEVEYNWIRSRAQRNLLELHTQGLAHSLEIYDRRDGARVGGSIGLAFNGLYISVSLYSRGGGAGNAAFLAGQAVLCRCGYVMHDAITPSQISRHHGGDLIEKNQDRILRGKAVDVENSGVVFPSFVARLPINEFAKPLMTEENYGRPFQRQERDASEEQDRSQTVEDIWQARARNRRRGQTRYAGPGA